MKVYWSDGYMYYEEIDKEKLIIIYEDEVDDTHIRDMFKSYSIIDSCGTVFVINSGGKYIGCITRGDVVRANKNKTKIRVNKNSKYIFDDKNMYHSAKQLEKMYNNINVIAVIDKESRNVKGAIRIKSQLELFQNDLLQWKNRLYVNTDEYIHFMKEKGYTYIYILGKNIEHAISCGNCLLEYKIVEKYIIVCLDEEMVMNWNAVSKEKVITYSEWLTVGKGAYMFADLEMYDENAFNKNMFDMRVPDLGNQLKKYGVNIRYISIPDKLNVDIENNVNFFENGFEIWAKAETGSDEEKMDKYQALKSDLMQIRYCKQSNGIICVNDYKSKYVNFVSGRRLGKERYDNVNTIYLLGPCLIVGNYCDDENTVGRYLQDFVKGLDYNVVSMGGIGPSNFINLLGKIKVKRGDYIYVITTKSHLEHYDYDIEDKFIELFNLTGQFFYDIPIHCNNDGNKCVALAVYQDLQKMLIQNKEDKEFLYDGKSVWIKEWRKKNDEYCDNKDLQEYKKFISKERVLQADRVGAIVMNCNPFTNGHLYLIEVAAQRVDCLYIFVVSEDRSDFAYEDRISLVKEGTRHLKNVKVLPSGRFVLSQYTFSQYFEKNELQGQIVDTSKDVTIFAQHIAPLLNITIRFVGEEPLDYITYQYNETMKELLPDYGIEVCEIPRKQQNGQVISASRVRKCLADRKFEEIKKMVPECTYKFLEQKYRML